MEPSLRPEAQAEQSQPGAASTSSVRPDYDSPWKEAIEQYFAAFLAFFFPHIYADIAWDKGYAFLDTALERIVRDATLGRRYADRLVKVFLRDGAGTWLLIHIEIQGYPDPDLRERMYVYNYRIFDRYGVEVVSLLVLTGDVPVRHTRPYRRGRWGCRVTFHFPVVRVRDTGQDWAALEQSQNPFAVVVMAHLLARDVPAGAARKAAKFQLIRGLYSKGLRREDILALFRFIDWLLVLPPELERELRDELYHLEETYHMPYVTSIERLGRQEGFEQGLQQGLQQGQMQATQEVVLEAIAARFGSVSDDVLTAVQQAESREALHTLLRQAMTCPTLEALREALRHT